MKTEDVKKQLLAMKGRPRPTEMLSTGSTLLNLALTNTIDGGFLAGSYVLFVGDTESGKTFVCMTCFAEAARNPAFDRHRFLFFNRERGAQMDVAAFFGRRAADRLEEVQVETLEEMYYALDDAMADDNPPFIAVVDSIDAFTSKYEQRKFAEGKTAAARNTQAKGDFGDGKAKIHSRNIRRVLSGLERTGSIIVFINQTRDNIDAGLFESKKTHSGGNAISFYAQQKLWSSNAGDIKKEYRKRKRQLGIYSRIRVVRTRVTGKHRTVVIPIYHSVGIDDVGSCVDYLVDEGEWKKNKAGIIDARDFKVQLRREELVQHVETEGLVRDLRELVADVWAEIEAACVVERRRRYE